MFIYYLQSGIVSDGSIKKEQNKIHKILYTEGNKKDNPDSYWDFEKERRELIDIVADLNGCTSVYYSNSLH